MKKVQRDNGIVFAYNPEADCFKCSQGKFLLPVERNCKRKSYLFDKYQCKECPGCPEKEQCTTSLTGRTVYWRLDGEWLAAYMKKMKTSGFKRRFRARKYVVEHPFETMKCLMANPHIVAGQGQSSD
jgi:hypothetical protein